MATMDGGGIDLGSWRNEFGVRRAGPETRAASVLRTGRPTASGAEGVMRRVLVADLGAISPRRGCDELVGQRGAKAASCSRALPLAVVAASYTASTSATASWDRLRTTEELAAVVHPASPAAPGRPSSSSGRTARASQGWTWLLSRLVVAIPAVGGGRAVRPRPLQAGERLSAERRCGRSRRRREARGAEGSCSSIRPEAKYAHRRVGLLVDAASAEGEAARARTT